MEVEESDGEAGRFERRFMLDTSALSRRDKPAVAQRIESLMAGGLLARCVASDLEAGVMARNGAEILLMYAERAGWLLVEIGKEVAERARMVQSRLAAKSQHRGVKSCDLLIAAAAELAGLVVLHYDRDYDRIAMVTGQDCEWVVPAGEAD